MSESRSALVAIGACFAVFQASILACSWDNPIWPKDKRSDTALFRFVIDGKAGYVDASGKVVVPAKFKVFGNHGYDDFFEGFASTDILRPSLIDSKGAAVEFAPLRISGFDRFSEGLIQATVTLGKVKKTGFADHRGRLVIPAKFDGADAFSEGLASVRLAGKLGYINHTGTLVIAPQFSLAESFSESAARVILADGPCNFVAYGPCGAANPNILGLGEYRQAHDTGYSRCQYAFIDRTGALLFPLRFPDALDFSEGVAAVGDGKHWGFINKAGVFEIPLRFDAVGSFSEGLARFRDGMKWGFIDRTGRIVIRAQYERADDFSAGTAVVGANQRVWFIDRQGSKLFSRDYSSASAFRLGLAHVADGQTSDYIDRVGRIVFSYAGRN